MAADVRYTIREAMRNKELVVHYRQNLESNHRQCKFPQLSALFHPNKSCRRRNQMDKQGFKSPARSEFGTKRSQVQILSPRPSKAFKSAAGPWEGFFCIARRLRAGGRSRRNTKAGGQPSGLVFVLSGALRQQMLKSGCRHAASSSAIDAP